MPGNRPVLGLVAVTGHGRDQASPSGATRQADLTEPI
jgi:hypothetical protein